MCKEFDVGKRFTPPRFPQTMRAGKTKRDKESGAWSNRLANLAARGIPVGTRKKR